MHSFYDSMGANWEMVEGEGETKKQGKQIYSSIVELWSFAFGGPQNKEGKHKKQKLRWIIL